MKKKIKILLAAALVGAFITTPETFPFIPAHTCNVYAQTYTGDGFALSYTRSGSRVTITGCTKAAETIIIPSAIDGYAVTAIGDRAFISQNAIKSIQLPDSVDTIGVNAFMNCFGLTSVYIPKNVSTISSGAFANCTDIRYFEVSAQNLTYTASEGVLFTKDMKTLVAFPPTTEGEYVIPDGVETIGDYAFLYSNLTAVTIPNTVTTIGKKAFSGAKLDEVILPDSVETLGEAVFEYCSGTKKIVLPANITEIPKSFMNGCNDVEELIIPSSVTVIGDSAFCCCTSVKEVVVPDGVLSVGASAFEKCNSMTSVTLPEGLLAIGKSAFSQCSALESITLPDSLLTIGNQAFMTCSHLKSVIIPAGVDSVPYLAFAYCKNLEQVIFAGDMPSSVDKDAFSSCSALKALYYTKNGEGWSEGSINGINCTLYGFVKYDADCDGNVTKADAAWILAKAVNSAYKMPIERLSETYIDTLDSDADKALTILDAAAVLSEAE